MLVATFAFLNAPFKPAGIIPDKPVDAPRRTEMTVPEKRGWEHSPPAGAQTAIAAPSKEAAPPPKEKR